MEGHPEPKESNSSSSSGSAPHPVSHQVTIQVTEPESHARAWSTPASPTSSPRSSCDLPDLNVSPKFTGRAFNIVDTFTQPDLRRKPSKHGGVLSNLLKLEGMKRRNKSRATERKRTLYSQLSEVLSRTSMGGDERSKRPPPVPFPSSAPHSPVLHPRRPKAFSKRLIPHVSADSALNLPTLSTLDRFAITTTIANILEKQSFLMRVCRALLAYGAPSHRLEESMQQLATALDIPAYFFFLPNLMIVSFQDPDTHTSDTHLVRETQDLDMGKLSAVHDVVRDVLERDLSLREANARIQHIIHSPPIYPPFVVLFSYMLASATVGPLWFKAGWIEVGINAALGLMVGVFQLTADHHANFKKIADILCALIIGFVSQAAVSSFNSCFNAVALSALVILLPGYSVLTAVLELTSRYIVSGSARLIYSMFYTLLLGLALAMGSLLYVQLLHPENSDACPNVDPIPLPWNLFFVPFFSLALSTWLRGTPRQFPAMTIISIISYLSVVYTAPHLGKPVSPAFGGLVVGLLGNVYARFLRHDDKAMVVMLTGILFLVPGALGVQGTLGIVFSSQDFQKYGVSASPGDGFLFAVQMIQVCLGVAVGVYVSSLLLSPFGTAAQRRARRIARKLKRMAGQNAPPITPPPSEAGDAMESKSLGRLRRFWLWLAYGRGADDEYEEYPEDEVVRIEEGRQSEAGDWDDHTSWADVPNEEAETEIPSRRSSVSNSPQLTPQYIPPLPNAHLHSLPPSASSSMTFSSKKQWKRRSNIELNY
ncbi:uncharacterized protein VTP21DRAFT_10463 [Calcarisporiella thermophila]|uniref:uncharacterized protein n=1 Tax=Calcarisporiella thermophila TaxID=911321 RepID=UPI003742E6B9